MDHLSCHEHDVGNVGRGRLVTCSILVDDESTQNRIEDEEEEGDTPEDLIEAIDHVDAFEADGREFLEGFSNTLIVGGLTLGDVEVVDQHILALDLDEVEGEEGPEGDKVNGKTSGVEVIWRVHIFGIGTDMISALLRDEEDEE